MLREIAAIILLMAFLYVMAKVYLSGHLPEVEGMAICPEGRIGKGEFLSAIEMGCEGRYEADFYMNLSEIGMDYFINEDCVPPRETIGQRLLITNVRQIFPSDSVRVSRFGEAVVVCVE